METVPISTLSPSTPVPTDRGFDAVVTLLWPFSSATGQCALLLADPDARQRYQRGQVRVRFGEASARQIATSGIGIGDSVRVSLEGAQWLTESDAALVKTPGRSVEGELVFKNRLHISVKRGNNGSKTIDVDDRVRPESPKPSMLPPSTPVARTPSRPSFDAYGVAVYSSPAFMKRLRLSEGKIPYTPVLVSEDDDLDTVASRKRRRVSYKNITEWKFDAREPSPEKENHDSVDVNVQESPAAAPTEPLLADVEATGIIQDESMQDVVEVTNLAEPPLEEAATVLEAVKEVVKNAPEQTTEQAPAAVIAEKETVEPEVVPSPIAESSNKDEGAEGSQVENLAEQPIETTKLDATVTEVEPQKQEALFTSQVESSTSHDMLPSSLPRLEIPSLESEAVQQPSLIRDLDRPITPVLQPIATEGLPLPSPFPTSAQKIPSPTVSDIIRAAGIDGAEATETDQPTVQEQSAEEATQAQLNAQGTIKESTTSQHDQSTENTRTITAPSDGAVDIETGPSSSDPQNVRVAEMFGREMSADSSQEGSSPSEPRVVADTYEGFVDETSAASSSPVIEDVQIGWRSRGDRWDDESSIEGDSADDMESSSDDSEEDLSESEYNEEQIATLQEESDHDDSIEEPDWDRVEEQLQKEEAAIQEAREDLNARDLMYETDDSEMHDSDSDSEDDIEAKSDDDSAEDASMYGNGLQDIEYAVLPGVEEESSEESGAEVFDRSYQPSIPEKDMYSHPFGLDGANSSKETRTALPSQAESEDELPAGDETIAWRDRENAIQTLGQQAQAQPNSSVMESNRPAQHAPPPSSRPTVVELLSESDSDEEDEETTHTVPGSAETPQPESLTRPQFMASPVQKSEFSQTVDRVKLVLQNNQKDAHLEFTGQATGQIQTEMAKIASQVDGRSTRETKYNALKTICRIGVEASAGTGSYLAEGVKYRLMHDEVLVGACWKVYNNLSDEEKTSIHQPTDLLAQLEELEEKRDYCFGGFPDFLNNFKEKRGGKVSDEVQEKQQMPQSENTNPEPATQADKEISQSEIMHQDKPESPMHRPEQEVAETKTEAADQPHAAVVETASPVKDVNPSPSRNMEEGIQSQHGLHQSEDDVMEVDAEPRKSAEDMFGFAQPTQGSGALQANDQASPIDVPMLEAPEPSSFALANDQENDQLAPTSHTEDLMTDEHAVEKANEAPSETEVKTSVEVGPEMPTPAEAAGPRTERSSLSASGSDDAQEDKTESRPLTSSSFKTLSPTPAVHDIVVSQKNSRPASQVPAQLIEELDLSQVEPEPWTARFSQFSQSRSSRTHTRSETIPDSADEEASEVELCSSDASSRHGSPAAEKSGPLQADQKSAVETTVQPSQELGTGFSKIDRSSRQALGPSTLQSQLSAIQETTPPRADEEADEEMKSQVGLDDELLADYVQVSPRITEAQTTPRSTKKPARPLALFRGRQSAGSRPSLGDHEQQAARDEVMLETPGQGQAGTSNNEELGQEAVQPEEQVSKYVEEDAVQHVPTTPTKEKEQPAQEQEETQRSEAVVESNQIQEPTHVEGATSGFQLKPTLKPFAEVEASLFGTPVRSTKAKPQEPRSEPALVWRNAFSSKMSDIPVIGSWFTPQKSNAAPKAATERKTASKMADMATATPSKNAVKASPGPLAKQFTRDRSISPPPLQRYASQGTATSLSYFTPLAALPEKLNQPDAAVDVLAICTNSTTPAQRAKGGPKDFYTIFRIVDQGLHEYNSATTNPATEQDEQTKDVRVEAFRPWEASLPQAMPGDVVLLRGFLVRSRGHRCYLLSGAASAWCVWQYPPHAEEGLPYSEPQNGDAENDDRPVWARKGNSQRPASADSVREQTKGPPVEIGSEEREKAREVREWWEQLQATKQGLEQQQQKDVEMETD